MSELKAYIYHMGYQMGYPLVSKYMRTAFQILLQVTKIQSVFLNLT